MTRAAVRAIFDAAKERIHRVLETTFKADGESTGAYRARLWEKIETNVAEIHQAMVPVCYSLVVRPDDPDVQVVREIMEEQEDAMHLRVDAMVVGSVEEMRLVLSVGKYQH